jgi:hypothetical protein
MRQGDFWKKEAMPMIPIARKDQELKDRIELARTLLHRLAGRLGFQHPAVIRSSERLDFLLLTYQQSCQPQTTRVKKAK